MTPFLVALAFAVALWWLGTGIVLGLQQRLRPGGADGTASARGIALGVAAGAAGGAALLVWAAAHAGAVASLTGFTAALVLWGALELSHYLGFVTGTHTRACPSGARGWRRFRLALGTSIWHELSVAGTGLALVALLHDAPNPAGLHAFVVLWLMRWSAKLNLFLGVPNFSTEWFPDRHAHLASYLRRARASARSTRSRSRAASLVAALLFARTAQADGDARARLRAAGDAARPRVLEHVFLALPIADLELWNRWFARSDAPGRAAARLPLTRSARPESTRPIRPPAPLTRPDRPDPAHGLPVHRPRRSGVDAARARARRRSIRASAACSCSAIAAPARRPRCARSRRCCRRSPRTRGVATTATPPPPSPGARTASRATPTARSSPRRDRPPVVDLPLGASEDRVVGALDIERALTVGREALRAGAARAAATGAFSTSTR